MIMSQLSGQPRSQHLLQSSTPDSRLNLVFQAVQIFYSILKAVKLVHFIIVVLEEETVVFIVDFENFHSQHSQSKCCEQWRPQLAVEPWSQP